MAKSAINNVKLGAFVLGGLLFLVLLLYMIGKNRNIFGGTYVLKARFENVQGLVAGNNVRYAGIESGTVKKINILNDTVIEVTMVMDDKLQSVIRKNAIASIGTEGLVGNKVVNIIPSAQPAELAEEGDIINSKKMLNTDDILQTLNKTNDDVAAIASNLKTTVLRINNSKGLWALLNDETIPVNIRAAVANIRTASDKAVNLADILIDIVADVKKGKGSLGAVLTDTSFATNLDTAILNIKSASGRADSLITTLNIMAEGLQQDMNNGKGTVHAMLKDSVIVSQLNQSLENIRKATDAFNQNMEALKHNFLFRGYFKKQEKKKQKEQAN